MRQHASAHRLDALGLHTGDEIFRDVGLEFHRIGAGLCRRPDQVVCDVFVAFVIDANLGDNPRAIQFSEIHGAPSSTAAPVASRPAQ